MHVLDDRGGQHSQQPRRTLAAAAAASGRLHTCDLVRLRTTPLDRLRLAVALSTAPRFLVITAACVAVVAYLVLNLGFGGAILVAVLLPLSAVITAFTVGPALPLAHTLVCHGLCGVCGYDLLAGPVHEDRTRRCAECGATWREERCTRAPAAPDAGGSPPRPPRPLAPLSRQSTLADAFGVRAAPDPRHTLQRAFDHAARHDTPDAPLCPRAEALPRLDRLARGRFQTQLLNALAPRAGRSPITLAPLVPHPSHSGEQLGRCPDTGTVWPTGRTPITGAKAGTSAPPQARTDREP